MNIDKKINEILSEKKYSLAYLTEFGSMLYGTNTINSDHDFKGLYFPHIETLIAEEKCNSITFTTGDPHGKNTKDDVDIQFWSVNYWLNLLEQGDTNAIDLLFSMYAPYPDIRRSSDERVKTLLDIFYSNPLALMDLKNTKGYIAYSYMQAKKYGLKGSRLDILKRARDWFASKLNEETKDYKIGCYFDQILPLLYEQSYFFQKETNDEQCLWILGKGYCASCRLYEAVDRLTTEYNKYGHRAELALQNEGIDWKAVSHAIRSCYQVIEMADTNFLVYPLKQADIIKEIKQGKKDWKKEVEPLLVDLLEEAKSKLENVKENLNVKENHLHILRNYYKKFLKEG